MKSLNKAIIVGYVGKDPEIRYSTKKENMAYTTLSVATHSSVNGQPTQWHQVKLFGKKAEFARDYIKKGALCYVLGRIEHQSYIGQDGSKKYSTDIIADEISLLTTARSQRDDMAQEDTAEQALVQTNVEEAFAIPVPF